MKMHPRQGLRSRFPAGYDADCGVCPSARYCWGARPQPGQGIRARREPLLERGAELVRQGECARDIYIVASGALILRERRVGGRERVVGFRLPGELVGLEARARGAYPYTARALLATSVCLLNLPSAGGASASNALLERLLLKCAAQHDISAPWQGLPASERVAAFVEDFARRTQQGEGARGPIRLPMTRGDIGSYLGLAEETVVRSLRRLGSGPRLRVLGRTVWLGESQAKTAAPVS